MGEALYRKYRSKSLDEIVGQPHITDTLNNALKKGRISHAYLFTGPRGVGKTSIARILAHEINELPYTDESVHLDIIEIDAASNRRIDEIRDLRSKVHIAPTSARYKVYIIDEVHMLTKEAFNALLKTLEEPPEHVVFILATTEVQKLPETIISRTQRYTFKPINDQNTVEHLRELATKEKITIDDEALQLIAEHGGGSFRDSISLLDQVGHGNAEVTAETIRQVLGVPSKSSIKQTITAIEQGDVPAIIDELTAMYTSGYQAGPIASELSKVLRERALANNSSATELELLHKLINVPASHNPRIYLELVLLEAAMQISPPPPRAAPAKPKVAEPAPEPPQPEPEPSPEPPKEEKQEAVVEEPQEKPIKPAKPTGKVDTELWPKVLDKLKGQHNTLYGIARMANATLDGNELTLTFNFAFHERRCSEDRNRKIISTIIQEITGENIIVSCQVDAKAKIAAPKEVKATESLKTEAPNQPKSDTLDSITEVFGGGEVLD